ncbi:MAG: GxxExxY protein [Planctomycetes bacterium]|nr:GxxExxY protein [Planctomycetota bacterium]
MTTENTEKTYLFKDITDKIIGAAIEAHKILGPGLLEGIYEAALIREFALRNIKYEQQKEIALTYKNSNIGNHRIDLLVENEIIVELKSVEELHPINDAQLITYLKTTGKRVGLLINFNVNRLKDGIKRIIV